MIVQEKNRAIEFEVVLYDDDNGFVEGASPVISIRRHSDDKFWSGSAWAVAYTTIATTELTGNNGVKGTYVYVLAAQATQDTYAARVLYTFAGDANATPFETVVMTTDQLELLDTPSNFMADVSGLAVESGGQLDTIEAVTTLLPDSGALTAIATDSARLTVVRAAVLTDWINDGRLDNLLDAIPTTMRGTDNAALQTTLLLVKVPTDKLVFTTANKLDVRVDAVGVNAVTTPNDFKAGVSLLALQATLLLIPTTAMRGTDSAALAATAFNASTDNVNLAATGLDNIVITEITGPATKWREMMVQLWRAEFKKRILHKTNDTAGTMSHRNDADSANLLQAAYTEDSSDQTMASAS